jgi:glycosyltransferase involved in cell wall biosynthesis
MPVRNAQSTLSETVHEVLDLATDTVDRFEILIVDDGSTDATGEVAQELTRCYPQVRVLSHGSFKGTEEAIRTGLTRSQGEIVVMRDENGRFRIIERRPSKNSPSRPIRPNYLSRVKGFVFSE